MKGYHIRGGNVLSGKIKVSGAKNSALPVLAASIMTKGESFIENCPEISDVDNMVKILKFLGCTIKRYGHDIAVNVDGMTGCGISDDMMKEMRSSVFLAGSLLTRCGEAVISSPGGCNIGKRPIDIHIDGLRRLGASVEHDNDRIIIRGGRLIGAHIRLPYPSVGATENIMMAAIGAKGVTRISGAAREPEIVDLQNYINKCGGYVRGAGSSTVEIQGTDDLSGCRHKIISDRIEAGTYMLMALATKGEVFLEGAEERRMGALIKLLRGMGSNIVSRDGGIYVKAGNTHTFRGVVDTAPYPGFPTDLQPQFTAFMTGVGKGVVIRENIFEKRLEYAKELKKMGADIEIFEKQVIIKNNNILYGTHVKAKDLRGGAALVIAGLKADGITTIANTKYIKRGYSDFVEKIKSLGGEITENE